MDSRSILPDVSKEGLSRSFFYKRKSLTRSDSVLREGRHSTNFYFM